MQARGAGPGGDRRRRRPGGAQSERASASASSPFLYDGRGFLRTAGDAATAGTVTPTYDTAGLLHALLREPSGGPTLRYHILYLAGRPVAQLATEAGQPDRWWYLTTDHLDTPLVATDAAGAELWENRFEPFGTDPWAGTSAGALENEMYLRFPGQWEDEVWQEAILGLDGYYNVNRWYSPGIGRYSRPDPMNEQVDVNRYYYAAASPLRNTDMLGLLCQLTPRWRNCLSLILEYPVEQIKVIDHAHLMTSFHRGWYTTRRDRIYLPGKCSDFWNGKARVLHEYYHVVKQWNTGRVSEARYILEAGRRWLSGDDPHRDNRFEKEARDFAQTNLQNFKDCIGCAPPPPDPKVDPPSPCVPGVSARTRGIGVPAECE